MWVLLVLLLWCCQGSCTAAVSQDGSPVADLSTKCVTLEESDLPSHYVHLPTNITVSPNDTLWRLDFTIHRDEEQKGPLICVSLEVIGEKIRLSLFVGRCEDRDIVDFQLWKPTYVMPKKWTAIQVKNNASFVVLKVEGNDQDTPLVPSELTLPTKGLLRVTRSKSLSLALGCRVKCPATIGSKANTTDLSTIKELKKSSDRFFFRPGKDFMRMNFEMNCETPLGHEVSVGNTDLHREDIEELTPLLQWHKVFLDFDSASDVFKIVIDYRPAKEVSSGLHACSTFKSFSVRAAGEIFVSFTCDPSSGEVEVNIPEEKTDCESPPNVFIATVSTVVIIAALLIAILTAIAILPFCGYTIKIVPIDKPETTTKNRAPKTEMELSRDINGNSQAQYVS